LNPKYKSPNNSRIRGLILNNEAVMCDFVRLELQSYKDSENKAVSLLSSTLQNLETNGQIWDQACDTALKCRKRGIIIPNSNILVYSIAMHYGCHVFHQDKHFNWLDEITGQQIAAMDTMPSDKG
jgi:predicted nucleic acid-binding protein